MELLPAHDALVETLNVVFSGAAHNLSKAHWATVKRAEYMQIVRERKQQCATFSEVSIREEVAPTRLPEDGVPDHIQNLSATSGWRRQSPGTFVGACIQSARGGQRRRGGRRV